MSTFKIARVLYSFNEEGLDGKDTYCVLTDDDDREIGVLRLKGVWAMVDLGSVMVLPEPEQ